MRKNLKRYILLFWRGLTAFLSSVAEWFTVILGMKDDSKYGMFIRRTVGTCFTIIVFLFTVITIWDFCGVVHSRLQSDEDKVDDYLSTNDSQFLSRNLTYYIDYTHGNYVVDRDGKKLIRHIRWISKPLGSDSLICYSIGRKRGYFNMFTGEVVIEPKYAHAWVFSDGLASVDDGGWIKFIDQTGRVVFDPNIPYRPEKDGYVFHNNHCAVHNERGDRLGLIDRQGKWALEPEYFRVEPVDSFWIISNGKQQSVLDKELNTVLPFMDADLWINDSIIVADMNDHSVRTYSLCGKLLDDFFIRETIKLLYDTNEINEKSIFDIDEDAHTSEFPTGVTFKQKVARCFRYETDYGWYGLMAPDGHRVTPASYIEITAIGPDLYFCKTNNNHGVILNGKGQRVK